jgi:hypothetical protein
MLILKYLQMKSTFGWSLSNLAALLRQQLFIFRDLWAWPNAPWEGPPAGALAWGTVGDAGGVVDGNWTAVAPHQ